MEERYFTLKLTLSELPDGGYRSRIDSSPVGASEGSGHDFKLSQEQIKAWMAQAPGGQAPTRAALTSVGKDLFGLIFGGNVKEKFKQCLAVAREKKARLRIGLAVLPNALIAAPWEYLHDDDAFLLKSGHLIVRIIDSLGEKPAFFRPIRTLLVVIANPTKDPVKYPPFDADGHENELKKRLRAIDAVFLRDPDEATLADNLRKKQPDAIYFLGHGRYAETLQGQLVLAAPDGSPFYLDADVFASWVRESAVRFVYLNSCSTAVTGQMNPFSGVAQRLMLNGDVDAVVAMQTQVSQAAGLSIALGFFDEMGRGSSPELALALARMNPDDFHHWGVPVVYTYLGGTEDLDRNRLACLLSVEIGKSRHGLILPSFGMGILLDGMGEIDVKPGRTYVFPAQVGLITVKVDSPDPKTLVFPGDTCAREDVESAADIMGLLSRIASPAQIGFYDSTSQDKDVTHWFFFGSRSNKIVANLLKIHSMRFRFDYDEKWPGKWSVEEMGKGVHSVPVPSGLGKRAFAEQEDFGIIEKIIDLPSNRVFFIIAGLGSRATRGCGWWLARHWKELVRTFGAGGFGIMLHFPGGLTFDHAEWVNPGAASAFVGT